MKVKIVSKQAVRIGKIEMKDACRRPEQCPAEGRTLQHDFHGVSDGHQTTLANAVIAESSASFNSGKCGACAEHSHCHGAAVDGVVGRGEESVSRRHLQSA